MKEIRDALKTQKAVKDDIKTSRSYISVLKLENDSYHYSTNASKRTKFLRSVEKVKLLLYQNLESL